MFEYIGVSMRAYLLTKWQNDNAKSVALIASTAHDTNVLAAMYVYK